MDWNQFINTWVKTGISIISLLIASMAYLRNKKFRKMVRENNWYNYERNNIAGGLLQDAISMLEKKVMSTQGTIQADEYEILKKLIASDAFNQDVLTSIVKQIQDVESFNEEDFLRWFKEGKISQEKVSLFKLFMITDKKKKFIFF